MGPGCCDFDTMINLSLIRLPEDISINFQHPWYWKAAMISLFSGFVLPYYEYLHKRHLHRRQRAQDIVPHTSSCIILDNFMCLSIAIHVIEFFNHILTIRSQPKSSYFQNNTALLCGYLFLMSGLIFIFNGYKDSNWTVFCSIGGTLLKVGKNLLFFGLSLIFASAAGLLICIISTIASYIVYSIEKYVTSKRHLMFRCCVTNNDHYIEKDK